ncbi:MAG: pirin family protein [Pseudomonadota bacterium]
MTFRNVIQKSRGQAATEGAGVKIRRFIATADLPQIDPFLLLDEFKSDRTEDFIAGFPPHPHRGFETVTYMLRGRSRHKDSTGAEGLLQSGDVQWMTAGRGVIHSEMPEAADGELWGYQLWVNLPAAQKMIAPRYQDIPAAKIPEVTLPGGTAKVIAGTLLDTTSPADSITGITYLDVSLEDGAAFSHGLAQRLAQDDAAFLFVIEGSAAIGTADATLDAGELGHLGSGDEIYLQAKGPTRFLLVAGTPLREPIARGGPFVMNSRAEIQQAFVDYQNGQLA